MKRNPLILALACLSIVGCFQKREYLRYIDVVKQVGEVETQVRLIGEYHSDGKVAVGQPYKLFISFYPASDDLDRLNIRLTSIDGDNEREFKSVRVKREKAFEKDGDFQFISIDNLELPYVDYFIDLDTNIDALDYTGIPLKRDPSSKKENSWWSKASSI
jgi:hypothetical protein